MYKLIKKNRVNSRAEGLLHSPWRPQFPILKKNCEFLSGPDIKTKVHWTGATHAVGAVQCGACVERGKAVQ